ncbi:unnamed protein product [Thlaspi arvense]|uniref:Uncharacterized protein n=1 Tax=Thlaspi arvense TaxID=13288 RepID=A0AAU9S0Z9_THLAR|nr:unnamed protein product [Thlaspi arvense]
MTYNHLRSPRDPSIQWRHPAISNAHKKLGNTQTPVAFSNGFYNQCSGCCAATSEQTRGSCAQMHQKQGNFRTSVWKHGRSLPANAEPSDTPRDFSGTQTVTNLLMIMFLVPIRQYVLPSFFKGAHLQDLDAAEYEEAPALLSFNLKPEGEVSRATLFADSGEVMDGMFTRSRGEIRRVSSIKLGGAGGSGSAGGSTAGGVELMRRVVSFQNPRVSEKVYIRSLSDFRGGGGRVISPRSPAGRASLSPRFAATGGGEQRLSNLGKSV